MKRLAILSVDDEKIILDSIKIQIENYFHNRYIFEYAESADEALEVIDELVQDGIDLLLVISDYMMPGMKGDEFARQLKEKMPHVNIVLLTGQIPEEKSLELLQNHTVMKVMQKPWKENELISLISKLGSHVGE